MSQGFAKKSRMVVFLVSQNKQQHDRGEDPRPQTGDMLGSSAMRIMSKLIIGLFCPSEYCKAPSSTKGPYGVYAKFMSAHPDHVDLYPELLEAWVLKNVLGAQKTAIHLRVNRATGLIENFDDYMRSYL